MCGRLRPAQSNTTRSTKIPAWLIEYQHGVFACTPIKAAQDGDTLRVEIGPVEGSFPGMLEDAWLHASASRGLATASVTVNGAAVKRAGPRAKAVELRRQHADDGHSGCEPEHRIEGHHRSPSRCRSHRAPCGSMASTARWHACVNLRRTCTQTCRSRAAPPDLLIDAMQTGDRLGYHPARARDDIRGGRPIASHRSGHRVRHRPAMLFCKAS